MHIPDDVGGVGVGKRTEISTEKEDGIKPVNDGDRRLVRTASLLALAVGRLAVVICSGACAGDVLSPSSGTEVTTDSGGVHAKAMAVLLSTSPILVAGLSGHAGTAAVSVATGDVHRYLNPVIPSDSCLEMRSASSQWHKDTFGSQYGQSVDDGQVAIISNAEGSFYGVQAGGRGSFESLDPAGYRSAQRHVLTVLLRHTGLYGTALRFQPSDEIVEVFWASRRIMEGGVRKRISTSEDGESNKEGCGSYCRTATAFSNVLLALFPAAESSPLLSTKQILGEIEVLYGAVGSLSDVDALRERMDAVTRLGVLRLIGFRSIVELLSRPGGGLKTLAALECVLSSLPLLMGRGAMNSGAVAHLPSPHLGRAAAGDLADAEPDLGIHYLSHLSGCAFVVRDKIREAVHGTYSAMGKTLADLVGEMELQVAPLGGTSGSSPTWTTPSAHSVILSLLSSCFVTIHSTDNDGIIGGSGILVQLRKLLPCCRCALTTSEDEEKDTVLIEDSMYISSKLLESSARHADVAMLRCAVSLMHVLSAQLAHQSRCSIASGPSILGGDVVSASLGLLREELRAALREVGEQTRGERRWREAELAKADWERLGSTDSGRGKSGILPSKLKKADSSLHPLKPSLLGGIGLGVRYLLENGSFLQTHGRGTSSPPSVAPLSSGGAAGDFVTTSLGTLRQYLKNLLNILCSIARSPGHFGAIASDPGWISMLLTSVGCSVSSFPGSDDNLPLLPPVRFRVRIIRLLRGILPEAEVNAGVVSGLLHLAGLGLAAPHSDRSDIGRYTVTREVVSLLRLLFTSVSWKSLIGDEIQRVYAQVDLEGTDIKEDMIRRGCLAFLCGVPGRVAVGSTVLLKPSAAASITDASGSSTKSHGGGSTGGSSGNTALSGTGGSAGLAVAGAGLEGIVAGLCRRSAMAGMVSGVDVTNGTCEVVLFDRQNPGSSSLRNNIGGWSSSSSSSTSSQHGAMTVRAIRANLSDVVSAEEVPVEMKDLDISVGSALRNAARFLSDVKKEDNNAKAEQLAGTSEVGEKDGDKDRSGEERLLNSQLLDGTKSILALRSCIALVSDKHLIDRCIGESPKECFHDLLRLASKMLGGSHSLPAGSESLSLMPEMEARFWHIWGMLLNTAERQRAVDSMPMEFFEKLLEDENGDALPTPARDGIKDEEPSPTPPTAIGALSGDVASTSALHGVRGRSYEEEGGGSSSRGRGQRQSSSTSGGARREEDEEANTDADEAVARQSEETAAAHLREAAIVQMAELGLPRSWSEYALRRVGGTNIEAAVHFCLERGGDMERLLSEERERDRRMTSSGGSGSLRRRNIGVGSGGASHLIRQLIEMGFPSHWCAEALAATGNNVDEALTWILTNGERLSAQDQDADEQVDEDDDEDDDEDESIEEDAQDEAGTMEETAVEAGTVDDSKGEEVTLKDGKKDFKTPDRVVDITDKSSETEKEQADKADKGWPKTIACPLCFVSGRSKIDPQTLEISGLDNGGFSSVGTKGIALSTGKWYYEAILVTAGCLQIGWADSSFAGHCQADRGDGCGDGPSSWAYDGWRRYRWHSTATEWGCRWQEGDVVGCLVDLDEYVVSFTLNGHGEDIGMGVAFSANGFRPCGGVYPCVSFNKKEKIKLILGGDGSEGFIHAPPPGYRGVGEAVHEAVKEREILLNEEETLKIKAEHADGNAAGVKVSMIPKKFLCDFSDGEHGHELFAWQHRYYGSDASVHLGSGSRSGSRTGKRTRKNSGRVSGGGNSGGSLSGDVSGIITSICVTNHLSKVWKNFRKEDEVVAASNHVVKDAQSIVSEIRRGYDKTRSDLEDDLLGTCVALGVLYARKLLLHIMLTLSEKFSLDFFIRSKEDNMWAARSFWVVLESCCSLQAAGWVGEAGAMAVAAEALGLGISSNDHHQHGSSSGGTSTSTVVTPGVAEYEGSGDTVSLPSGSISQVLSTVMLISGSDNDVNDLSLSLAGCAEAAIGGDCGGSAAFLLRGIRSSAAKSDALQRVLLAAVRRSVRLLAVVEYGKNDLLSSSSIEEASADDEAENVGTEVEISGSRDEGLVSAALPDARLALFLTGLLLSLPKKETKLPVLRNECDSSAVASGLFEAWSIGLLSASAPWRMICAMTASNILNLYPASLGHSIERIPTLERFYRRLGSTVVRRCWAERAAVPICSRYVQSMIELMGSVRRAKKQCAVELLRGITVDAATPLPLTDSKNVEKETPDGDVESIISHGQSSLKCWECDEGWINSDMGWEVWTGSVEIMSVDWLEPPRSTVRTLMDGGDGPPMLWEGCMVMRGLDWDGSGSGSVTGNEDGLDIFESEKAEREKERQSLEDEEKEMDTQNREEESKKGSNVRETNASPEMDTLDPATEKLQEKEMDTKNNESRFEKKQDQSNGGRKKKRRKKVPNPKLPIGTVVSIEPWNGIPGAGRRVRWHLTGHEGVYRFGGDGGRYDIVHVEINDKATRVRKRHPLPESAEQCAARYGFGATKKYRVLLRLRKYGEKMKVGDGEEEIWHGGILEWPDFAAGVRVECLFHLDGAITITEQDLMYGSKDSGWEARFGQPSFAAGTVMVLSPTAGSSSLSKGVVFDDTSSPLSHYEELLGSSSYTPKVLRNRADGQKLRVTSEMRLLRGRKSQAYQKSQKIPVEYPRVPPLTSSSLLPPIFFDSSWHAPSISLSQDGRTASCVTSEGRGTAFASVGFTKGVHYWEVKLEQADIGSVFVGVAEKPNSMPTGGSSSFGYDSQPRLNKWHGWGFVNFRATYTAGGERVYGAHCHAGDTVGVLLDCDTGRISFFFDGVKYGEHIMNDLGCAFENMSPFGFNADGCGSGGAGQGAPSGVEGGRVGRYPANGAVRPRALWPVVGLRNAGDKVTLSGKWMSGVGVDGVNSLKNALSVDEVLCMYQDETISKDTAGSVGVQIPPWFVEESYQEYERWKSGKWLRSVSRGSGPYPLASFGLDVDVDTSSLACASACASLGLRKALLSGDRLLVKRSAGRMLELPEEAVVLGACQGRLFYRIVLQKSEGGSLTEGGGRAWFWDESEVVDGGLTLIGEGLGLDVELPLLERFKCMAPGGLRIVYNGGAVVRSDLEIFDGSANIGTIPNGTVIPQKDVLERRVNSCGVVRYRVRYVSVGEGWISSRIRGGKEEAIVEPVWSESCSSDAKADMGDSGTEEKNDCAPLTCAEDVACIWYEEYQVAQKKQRGCSEAQLYSPADHYSEGESDFSVRDFKEYEELLKSGIIPGLSVIESDSLLVSTVNAIADFSPIGDAVDCPFVTVASAVSFAVKSHSMHHVDVVYGIPGANQAAAAQFSLLNVKVPPTKALLVRIAMLRAFNRRARFALPWLSVRPAQEGSAVLGGLRGFGSSIERVGKSRNANRGNEWIQAPSIATRLRNCRQVLFLSVKKFLLESIVDCTATPTPLSPDEYELPREVRTVRINRLKATRAMSSNDSTTKRKHSVFSQLQREMRGWSGAALRRGHVATGHGGQKRAFKVKLVGEGVNDYSGPYREVFTDAINEVTSLDGNGCSALGVLEPTPNNIGAIGDDRSLFMFKSGDRSPSNGDSSGLPNKVSDEESLIREWFYSLLGERLESVREVEDSLFFLGRLCGTACRHGILVDLPLPLMMVWNRVGEYKMGIYETIKEIDVLGCQQAKEGQLWKKNGSNDLLETQQRMLNSFAEGLGGVLPTEIFPLMTGTEIQQILCGNVDIDVDLLQRVVEYEGYEKHDAVIEYFWEVLREMTSNERKLFLQFVWARSRLPARLSDFDTPFTIQRDVKSGIDDSALPRASTCFFSLSLPEYRSKELLKKKLLFAIENVTTMESDYVTNDAEVGEGWRGL